MPSSEAREAMIDCYSLTICWSPNRRGRRCPLCAEHLGRPAFPYSLWWKESIYTYRAVQEVSNGRP